MSLIPNQYPKVENHYSTLSILYHNWKGGHKCLLMIFLSHLFLVYIPTLDIRIYKQLAGKRKIFANSQFLLWSVSLELPSRFTQWSLLSYYRYTSPYIGNSFQERQFRLKNNLNQIDLFLNLLVTSLND